MMEPVIAKNQEDLSEKAAQWLIQYINETLRQQDRFTLVLSGGNTPKKLYQLLASPGYRDQIDWTKIHFFWGDERHVPFSDERNNAKMAVDTLLSQVPVPKKHIHIIQTDIEPDLSAALYEKILHQYFDDTDFTFDLVLLGLGDNAHTLSLFPGYANIYEKEKWVIAFYLAEQNMYRITLTTPIVNRARSIAFLVTGGDKAVPLYKVLYGDHDPDLYPAQLIQPYHGNTLWFVDKAAAAELENAPG